MKTTVIITHYRSPQVLKLCLGYIYNWKKEFEETKGEAEIIVTDSDTQNETREMMRERYPDIKFLTSDENIGFGKAVNKALREAKGEYILMMNADVIVPRPKDINYLIEYLERNIEVGLVGPKILNFDNTHQPSAFRYYTPLSIMLRRTFLGKTNWGKAKIDKFLMKDLKDMMDTPTDVDWIMGSIMLTKKEYIEKIGFFDERFFMYMEDVDLCRRFWEAGKKVVYYPLAATYHFHGKQSRAKNAFSALFNKYTRIHLTSAFKYFKKYGLKTPRYGE